MTDIPELELYCGSWVVVNRSSGKPVCEIFDRQRAEAVNHERFALLTTQQWLARYNRLVQAAGGVEPSDEAFMDAMGDRDANP